MYGESTPVVEKVCCYKNRTQTVLWRNNAVIGFLEW
jgi:hypothetical protein